jgi:hypothetical protein
MGGPFDSTPLEQGVLQMRHRSPLVAPIAIAAAILVLAAAAPVAAWAQGGKAEPLRIAFDRGKYSASISERVRGDEEAEYVLAAKEGQRLIINLTSVPAKSSMFTLFGEGEPPSIKHDADFNYSGVLPKTGDYFITVKRVAKAKGTSGFRMSVIVR